MNIEDVASRLRQYRVLGGILLLGVVLRIHYWRDLGSLSWDSAHHALGGVLLTRVLLNLSSGPISEARLLFQNYPPIKSGLFFYPPGYDLMTVPTYLIFGFNDLAARVPNMVLSSLIFLPVFLLATEIYNKRVGYFAAFFAAITPFFIGWGQNVGVDTPLVFFLTLSLYYTLRAIRTDDFWAWVLGGVFLGAAGFMKPIGAFLFPILYGYALIERRQLSRNLLIGAAIPVAIVSSYFLAGVALSFTFGALGDHASRLIFHWITDAVTHSEAGDPKWYTVEAWIFYLRMLPLQLGWPVLLLAGIGVGSRIGDDDGLRNQERLLLVIIIYVFLFFVFLNNKNRRYTMPYIPVFCIFAAYGVSEIFDRLSYNKRLARGTVLAIVLVSVVGAATVLTSHGDTLRTNFGRYPETGTEEAAATITSGPPGLVVVHNQSERVSLNAVTFHLVTRDPHGSYSVYWQARMDSATWVVSPDKLERDGFKLHRKISSDRTVYVYLNRTAQ